MFELVASTITCSGAVWPLRSFCAKPASISIPTVLLPRSIRSPNLARVGQLPLHVKVWARSKARDQFAAFLAVIEIEHHRRNVMDFKRGRVTKDQHLNNRRANKDKARPLVAEDLDELLDQHLLQAPQHRFLLYSSLL